MIILEVCVEERKKFLREMSFIDGNHLDQGGLWMAGPSLSVPILNDEN
jgi:hypothetical protein